MNTNTKIDLVSLGQLAAQIAKTVNDRKTYPVLGAEGAEFFIEISSGVFHQREILTTIHINFCTDVTRIDHPDRWQFQSEFTISLPSSSYLVALLSLLTVALGTDIRILHPLDHNGNYLADWDAALTVVSDRSS